MYLKDYYQLLNLEPSATLPEIKKAFRKLAHQHHPDKNNNDPYSQAQFAEIKEAYEVLTDPTKKEYYLQQRWYNQSIGNRKTQDVITPVSILKQSLELERYVSRIDVFRMDKLGLQQYILELLSDSTIEQLHQFNEPETNRQIISILCKAIRPLPENYTNSIVKQLYKLAKSDPLALEKISSFVLQNKKKRYQEKYMPLFILIITAILCLLIYLGSR